ncbi:MAG: segregation ATPase FtsK/SpoIIIE, family [Actinomycetota bacterium]
MTATYDIALLLVAANGQQRPVVATVGERARVADLLEAIDSSSATLFLHDRALPRDALLVEAGVVAGETLGLDAPVVVPWRQLGPELRVIGGVGAGYRMRVNGAAVVVGRDRGADVVLASNLVSRRHATFRWTGDGFTVKDLDSRHGVVVDGVRTERGGSVSLPAYAAVVLGDSVITMAPTAPAGRCASGATPFHQPFVGGRLDPVARPDPITVPAASNAGARRSFAPFVVPSAGAVALAAAAGGAPTPVALAATPAAMIVGLLAERGVAARSARRVEHEHDTVVAEEERAVRAAAGAYAAAARSVRPDPAALLSACERHAPIVWSSRAASFVPRVGLYTEPDAVQLDAEKPDAARLAAARAAHCVPAGVDFAAGPVVIDGPDEVLDALTVWLVAQTVALVGPHELDVVVVTDYPARWAWTAWLPHTRGTVAVLNGAASPAALPGPAAPLRLLVLDGPTSTAWYQPTSAPNAWQLWRVRRPGAAPAHAATVVTATGETSGRIDSSTGTIANVRLDALGAPDAFASELALHLSRLHSPLAAGTATTDEVALSELMPSITRASELVPQWQSAANELEVVVGRNDVGPLRVALRGQNSHVLVAGTTGSGKTRLLETLGVSVAAAHSPAHLNLLVIDFKGGNELSAIASLPHCVGLVSDRDMAEVDRALAALTRELARRDELFASAGATDLDDYTTKTGAVLARLLVIADEFGQFRRDDPLGQRVNTLLRIAAQGRSKGLHLVLATQSPSVDVTPEIRQNVGVRMCLRVAEAAESVAVLGVPDAAALTQPGRVIIAVDNDLTVGQVALAGAPGNGPSDRVIVRDLFDAATRRHDAEHETRAPLLPAIAEAMRAATNAAGAFARPLLRPPLRDRVDRRDLAGAKRSWTAAGFVIGERDRPGASDAAPLTFDPARDGAITFVGGPRSGRTEALLSLAEAARDQSDGAHPVAVHAIDWAGGLAVLNGADGDAGVVRRGDTEHLRRVVRWLATDGIDGVTRLVLVDGLDALFRDLREIDGGAFASFVADVLQNGPRRRVHVAATVDAGALLTGGALLAGRRVVLPVDDAALALASGLPPRRVRLPGRAIVMPDGDEVHIGLAGQPARGRRAAGSIAPMPARVRVDDLPAGAAEHFVLGVGGDAALEPVAVDLDAFGPVAAVIGRAGSGRSTALETIAATYTGTRTIVRIGRNHATDWTPAAGAPALVLVDDAARAAASHAWLHASDIPEQLEAAGHVLVAAFEQCDLTGLGYSHWLMRRPVPGLLLSLDATADRVIAGERLGFHPPTDLRTGPPGRGWWCRRGHSTSVQVATIN